VLRRIYLRRTVSLKVAEAVNMAPVTLPPSFYNSFWSADYRTGLEVLFKQLDKVGFILILAHDSMERS
jgi:hypothetical protein